MIARLCAGIETRGGSNGCSIGTTTSNEESRRKERAKGRVMREMSAANEVCHFQPIRGFPASRSNEARPFSSRPHEMCGPAPWPPARTNLIHHAGLPRRRPRYLTTRPAPAPADARPVWSWAGTRRMASPITSSARSSKLSGSRRQDFPCRASCRWRPRPRGTSGSRPIRRNSCRRASESAHDTKPCGFLRRGQLHRRAAAVPGHSDSRPKYPVRNEPGDHAVLDALFVVAVQIGAHVDNRAQASAAIRRQGRQVGFNRVRDSHSGPLVSVEP